MTRYARAKGSSADNAREPEEATSWADMKREMNKRARANPELEEEELEEEAEAEAGEKMGVEADESGSESGEEVKEDAEEEDGDDDRLADSLQKDSKVSTSAADKKIPIEEEEAKENSHKKKKRKRKKDKCLNCKQKGHMKMDCPELPEERRKELQELLKLKQERKGKGTGRKKNKKKAGDVKKSDDDKSIKKDPAAPSKNRKNKNKVGAKKHMVRKDKSGQVVQAGEGLFQGFRVKEDDAKRLKQLRRDLEGKGLKGEELEAEMKKERRRAEKELARFNKMLCFHCRKPGHLLSECPDAQKEAMERKGGTVLQPSGQCYKCGSADHTSRECRSKRKGGDAFAFAVCFICKETGHLAKACPDNPRGLYPRGGGCRFCGSVEHLKSDCPRKAEKDGREEVRARTVDSTALEVEEAAQPKQKRRKLQQASKKKVVHF